ncbi:MAG: PKD domain-containing protein [Flavobacteriia bacterium]|nr:PKD domain-containing protein [Flavobacteriia bacterium]
MKKVLLFLWGAFAVTSAFSQKPNATGVSQTQVITCTDFHITKPLSELAKEHPYVPHKQGKVEQYIESFDRKYRDPQKFEHTAEENPALYGNDPATMQTEMGQKSDASKAPIKNWPGQSGSGFRPFDPSGAAGPNHYIQAINGTPFRVFNKSTGANMLTANIGSLWSPATPNDGDPIILYDKYADRWLISQFGQTGNKIYIAISQTADPLGSYYTYTFTSPEFPDYLKFGIWADGYYMTSNQATDKVFCFERDQMLLGNPSARSVSATFTTGPVSSFFVPLPADADGGLPTVGTPCPFFSYSDNAWGTGAIDGVKIWNMSVTWGATPSASIALNNTLATAAFDASYDASWNDVSQPGTTQKLDGIGGVPTFRAQWRKWTGYNTVVLNWGVKISASQRSIKWVELRQNQTTGVWSLYQEGTYTPDAHTRWIGSIAMDNNGSIGMAYCKSSTTVYPSLCYTGRLSTDPLGTFTFAETVAAAGTAAETSGNRFGDYSQLSLDPDGITFWHTGEYTIAGGTTTRVYSFQLPVVAGAPVADFSADNVAPCIGSTVNFTDMTSGVPTSWAWTFSPTTVTYTGGTSATSQNPKVIFNAAGAYTVTLVATNASGSNTMTKTAYINPLSAGSLPFVENFEGATFPPTGWTLENADAPSIAWGTAGAKGLERRTATGNTGSATGCAGIELFNYSDSAQVDNLISLPVSLVSASAPKLTFKRAYKYYNSSTAPTKYHDELKVYISTDCGATWGSAVYFKKGAQLATSGTLNTTFSPATAADWDIDTINLTSYIGQSIKVKFEVGNRYGNNLYIDDININSTAAVVASVAITSNDADNTFCAGASVTFTATPTNGGSAPTYQWQVNGTNVGTNSATYTTTTLTNGQSVTCIMTSNLSGVTGSPATSNAIVNTVNAIPSTPVVTTNSPVCAGSSINLTTATVTGATYAWSGPNSFANTTQNPTITGATTAMAGIYSLIVTKNGCSSAAGTATVVVNTTVTPTVSIAITAGGNPTCASQSVTFTATPTNGGTTPSYQWKVNGVNAGTNSATFTPVSIANNDVITCVMTSNSACASPTTATSSSITMTVTTTVTPSVVIAASSNPACSGSSVTFTATPTNGGTTPTYQWKVNGTVVGTGTTYTSSALTNGAVVTCVMTSSSSCASPTTATSSGVTMTINNTVTPSASIAITSGTNPTCSGTPVTFTVTPTNGGSTPTYQWQVNGTASGTGTTFTSSSLVNGSSVTCILTSNATCATTTTATSSAITMNVTSSVTPSVVIAASSNPACIGTSVTFTATPTNGGTPSYVWQINGATVGTGVTYTSTSLANNDVVTCIMTSTASCVTSSTATSNSVTMTMNSNVTPSVSFAITSGSNPLCQGSNVVFTATPTNGGSSPAYQWQVNNVNVGTNNVSFSSSTLANNDIVSCVLTSNAACASPSTVTSSTMTMTVNPIPSTPTISQSGLTLTSSATTGNQWYLNGIAIVGAVSQSYTATQNGNYTVVVTGNGCSSMTSSIQTVSTVSLDEVTNTGTHFTLYPNPSNGKFTLVFTSTEMSKFRLVLHNAIGQVVYEEEIKDFNGIYTKYFDVTEYGKGEYFLNIFDGRNKKMEKVIVY